MTIFGLDVSHHQPQLDWARCRQEGIEFGIIKATEGSTFTDAEFVTNLSRVRNAGVLAAAYHYVRSNASAADQVARIRSVVPTNVPVVPDVEANSGGVALVRELVDRLRAVGYRVPLLYLPRWYWQQIGSPSLAGLPPLWSSRYPDNTIRDLGAAYAKAPTSYWTGYGGLSVALLQFTSSARVTGYSPLDANAYQGTRAGLEALLYGTVSTAPTEEDIMAKPMLYRQTDELAVWAVTPMGRFWLPNQTAVNDYADKWGLPFDAAGNAVVTVGDAIDWAGPDLTALATDAHTAASSGSTSTGGGASS